MASGDFLHLSELRVVLLGGREDGKSSSGNTILGRKEFDLRTAAQCVKGQGEVAGRQVTVVDTPGWCSNFPVEWTTELVKQEIVHSVSLCPPGPHTLLLVIRLDLSFTEKERRSVEGHLQLLSDRVWGHTIVLFTHGDHLGDTTIEQHIETEGKALQWLVEKCGNRYHVLNNKNWSDDIQVTGLLVKMEEKVAGNRGDHYEMDREKLEKIEEKRRAEEERAQQRLMKMQEQRETLRSLMGDSLHLSELRIVLLGGREAGKSSSGNTILGREEFDLVTVAQCVKRQGEVAGRQVTVVNTPGWWSNYPVEMTTELVKQEIVRSVSLCPPGPHTLLLVIDLDLTCTEEVRSSFEGHLQLLSDRVWSHIIVLFTRGDRLGDTTIEQHIETEGKALQWLVEKCGNRYHVLNNENRGDGTQVTELFDKMEEMVAGNRGDHYEMDREKLEKIEEKRRAEEGKRMTEEEGRKAEEERAQQRLKKVQEQRETLRSLMGDSLHLSELRVMLLGGRGAGKSSSGNTILGREEFGLRTAAQCVKRQGEVAGRQVTVVDTPGWWSNLPVEWTTELVKQEIERSVSLCPPGPHTLLLVIQLGVSFTEEERRSVEGHLQLLSDRVWSHTIVLFTHGDCLGDTTIKQHIETEGKALQWLVEKCGNRYHVLNNKNRGDGTQVTELLDKMEEMVAGNRGDHYEMDREKLEKIEEKRRAEEGRAQQRLMKMQEQRETLRSQMGDSLHLSELRVVLLGWREAGKSLSGNTILGREEFDLRTTAQCVKRQGEIAGRQVTVVDTPGWWSNYPVEWTTELVKQEIVRSVSLCLPGPHTLLLVLQLDFSFTEKERRSVEGHLQLLSDRVWSHTLVLFTRGDHLGETTIEQHIETEGKALQWLVEKCGNRYHVLNNKNRGDGTQVTELLDKMEEMVAGNRGDHYEMDREKLEKIEEKRRAEEERAQQRLMKVQEQRETLRSLMGDSLHLSELRVVLLGGREAGKSSSGNTILGREEFDLRTAAQCVKRQGEVAGRQVTVVDTPGWGWKLPVEMTTELVKQEIVCSVSLCPPGPHTLLLVIRLDVSFTEEERGSVEGHLQLLSDRVWSHTIVLFTSGDSLGDTTIEQHIETESEALQWLVEKCGNRYHVLNSENRGDGTQVTELLDKMEEMVAGNRGGHYEMDREKLEKIEEKRRADEERAQQRLIKVQEQRETLRSLMGDSLHLSELRVVLLGGREAGKSSSGNTILGREEFDLRTAAQCVKRQGEVAGRQVTVVDTLEWWSNLPVERTTELVKQEIVRSVSLCPPGPHTLLLVIRLDHSFTEQERRSVEGHLQLLSDRVWSHTIVLFTHGDHLGETTIEQHIETEGKALQWLVEKCGNRYHVLNDKNRGDGTQVTELLDKMAEMVAGNRGDHYEMDRERLEKIERWRRTREERAKQREVKVMKQREILRTFIGDHLSELRVVLLGGREAGKSSSGNTILGREEFDLRIAAQCVKRQGEVAGRQVTVVDTPGWWRNLPVEETTELVKHEIVRSVSLCPPGPHTLLLVIDLDDSFTEEVVSSAEGHLELLSDRVWSHTIVLFTRGDRLGDTNIEQHIQREGKALQWLVEKCGNRYHVLNNENRGDGTQVTELLDKIDEMVAANSGDLFYLEIDGREEMNWSFEEEFQKPSLRGIDSPRPSMSGESRAETDWDSEQTSEAGSVSGSLRPEKWEGDRCAVQSQGSSGYNSQTSSRSAVQSQGSSGYSSQTSSRSAVQSQGSSGYSSQTSSRSAVQSQGSSSHVSRRSRPASDHSSEKETNLGTAHSWTSTPQGPTPTFLVTPDLCSYRLQCPHAGLFQCSLTGLGFQMEGEGEVLYSTVQWDEDLLASTGQTPAGPLFSIDCPQGSVCQLHLPHCEIVPGEGLGSLSVAHVSGDSVELLPPLRVPDTHVVVKVTELSCWGLLRRRNSTIRGLVLPFLELRSPFRPIPILNLVVVPANVLIEKVKEKHTSSTSNYLAVNSYCTLTRGEEYSLCCEEGERIQPEHTKIYWSYGPNYPPIFQVLLSPDTKEVKLRLQKKDGGEKVWGACIPLPAPGASSMGVRQTEHVQSGSAEEQLRLGRREFVNRVTMPGMDGLLDGLLEKGVINDSETESVKVQPERAKRARTLIDMVRRKGAQACSVMMDLLRRLDPFLYSTLAENSGESEA